MKRHSFGFKLLWGGFAALVLCAFACNGIALWKEYDPNANYYLSTARFPLVSCICAGGALICGIAAACVTRSESLSESIFSERYRFPWIAIGFFGAALLLAVDHVSVIGLFAVPFLVIAGLYAVSAENPKWRKPNGWVTALGFSTVIGSILLNAYYYFDFTLEMNAPVKIQVQLGLLMLMLCGTGELRYLLGIAKPKLYLVLSVGGITASAVTAVPLIGLYMTGRFTRPDYFAGILLLLTFAVSQSVRLIYLLQGHDKPDRQTDSEFSSPGTTGSACVEADPCSSATQSECSEENNGKDIIEP